MGKKKFIDKKKSATFQLLSHDSSDPYYADTLGSEQVFVRIDNNPYSVDTFDKSICNLSGGENPSLIFSDSPDDDDDGRAFGTSQPFRGSTAVGATGKAGPLPEHLRREILELGFPDDGYNYLIHLREIKNTGGGSLFCCNRKAKLNQLPQDVKAFDASRVQICEAKGDSVEELFYNVATKTVGVKVRNAVDPDVAVLLVEGDLSRFDSDVENLEEDFVVRANLPEEGHGVINDNNLQLVGKTKMDEELISESTTSGYQENHCFGEDEVRNHVVETGHECADAESRACHLLDEQFDLLECQEYRSDGEEDDDGCGDYLVEDDSLVEKFKHVLTSHDMDDFQLHDEYEAPADVLRCNERPISKKLLDSAADVVCRCVKYSENYKNGDEDELTVIAQESSGESEQWDCETIVSTYSNLDNRPGKIGGPEAVRKKKFETVSEALSASNNVIISLGKEKLPVDFLPQTSKSGIEKVKGVGSLKTGVHRSQQRWESKVEKKGRKAAVTEERRKAQP